MKIGIFDSGRGGEFIAQGLRSILPQHDYMVVNDSENVPYGSRTSKVVATLTRTAIQPLLAANCPVIVIACNTATMAAIETLRAAYPDTQFIGIEPMIKPAAAVSRSKHITVLATPLTLQSDRYRRLVARYAATIVIDEPNAAGWAAAIEHDTSAAISFDDVAQSIKNGSDTIVLACTHYITLRSRMAREFPEVTILEPTAAIARQITAVTTK